MPDSRSITLVAWENATKKKPEDPDQRVLVGTVGARAVDHVLALELPFQVARFGPSVWCDPTPPGPDALTVEDLRALAYSTNYGVAEHIEARDRLRRALDALGNGGTE